ncbi:MAG: hypothetical protein BMS9Abin09_0313 [Gammaproteobacteria bacterium]|nr:MAG: hypothetical protein BMS9Abin09_0313 [Gammaproteobacteria bacterium]
MSVEELKCNAREVDVIVHVDDRLDQYSRSRMEDVVEREFGVVKARFNAERHHLMIVAYDPERISSTMILSNIKHQNVNAQLV